MKREYFISFMNKKDGELRYSYRVLTFSKGIFNFNEVINLIEKKDKCSEVVILFFKELKKYEKGGQNQA